MKKKIVSMLLTVAMLLSVCALSLTSCTQDDGDVLDDIEATASKSASTLVMWVVTEDGTDPEQAEDVNKAMAEITKSKYKTNLVIRYLTMDEYYEKLEAAILETERLNVLKLLKDEIAKATKKANNEVTGAFKKGTITEDGKDDMFFTFVVDALKLLNSVKTNTTTNEKYMDTEISDEELEEMLIELVGQLVEYEIADAFIENEATLIATMQSELANPPAAADVGKKFIYMTQETIDMATLLFDLIGEHKEYFEELAKEEEDEDAEEEEEEEKKDDDEILRDEDGNMIVDVTVYPEVEDHQVDIIYLSGYEKYNEYIENEWIQKLDSELSGSAKAIPSYVSTSLLNAIKVGGSTYAIPNNNVIGEYTYMLIDKELFDKYYYTGTLKDVHSIVDVSDFIEDVAKYEEGVLPINGDVNYCLSLIAHYWSIDPETMAIDPAKFSVLGHAYKPDEVITRGSTAMTFSNLLADERYKESLLNLKEFEYAGYFGTPAEGQKSAISFVKGDASVVENYEDDNYVVVVDYPKAANEDIYANMFAISTYTSDLAKSMQIITLLNTDTEFRNLFQYGIEGVNYELNANGSVSMMNGNAYNMDISKTGNEFIAYVPEGMNVDVWEYAKQQNRESQVNPLLGFAFANELDSQEEDFLSEEAAAPDAKDVFYYKEVVNTAMIKSVAETSAKVWDEIQACTDIDTLEKLINTWSKTLAKDENVKKAMVYEMIEPALNEEDATIKEKTDEEDTTVIVKKPTVDVAVEKTMTREIKTEVTVGEETQILTSQKKYFLITKTLTPYQVYYRWMTDYSYLPANFGVVVIQ